MKTLVDYIAETIRRYGAVGSNNAVGYTRESEELDEDEEAAADAEDAPEQPEQDADRSDPILAKQVGLAAVGPMEESVDELALILQRAKLRD